MEKEINHNSAAPKAVPIQTARKGRYLYARRAIAMTKRDTGGEFNKLLVEKSFPQPPPERLPARVSLA